MAKTKGKSHEGKGPAKAPARAAKPAKQAVKTPARAAKSATSATPAVNAPARTAKPAKPAPKPPGARKPAAAPKTARAKPSSKPSLPLPPAPLPPPPPRDELPAPRDIARLTRYGERFGPRKIDVRWLPLQLPVTGGALAVFDPAVPKSWRVFDRPVGTGQFRAMLSLARSEDGKERLAAIVIHVGRPPIARWTVAHYKGQKKPKSADQLPRVPVTSGWLALVDGGKDAPGVVEIPPTASTAIAPIELALADGRRALALPCERGEYAAYWAVDAADKPICLVVDFDVFTQKDWKSRAT